MNTEDMTLNEMNSEKAHLVSKFDSLGKISTKGFDAQKRQTLLDIQEKISKRIDELTSAITSREKYNA